MQLSFRLDKQPGESHLALDGKKNSSATTHFPMMTTAWPLPTGIAKSGPTLSTLEPLRDDDDWKRTSERTLSVP